MARICSFFVVLAFGVSLLAACGGQSSQTSSALCPTGVIDACIGSSTGLRNSPVRPLRVPTGQPASRLYVTNFINSSVKVYSAQGQEETSRIGSPWGGLSSPTGIWTDGYRFYVTNYAVSGPQSVGVYNKNGKGPRLNERPRRWWGVNHASGITSGSPSAFLLYVANDGNNTVTVASG